MSDMSNAHDVFGLVLNDAEFSVATELLKAALLTIGAAIAALIFNAAAKRRELDAGLFNSVIKIRIDEAHELNRKVIKLISEYMEILEDIVKLYSMNPYENSTARLRRGIHNYQRLRQYELSVNDRITKLERDISRNRYDLGENAVTSMKNRINYFSNRVMYVKEYMEHCVKDHIVDLLKINSTDHPIFSEKYLEILIIEIVASSSHKSISSILNDIHDDFERVIVRKGRTRKYIEPINLEITRGMMQIHPINQDVRHKILILYLRLGERISHSPVQKM